MPDKPKVLLLSLPWTSLTEPSLGLGILKAELEKKEIECKIKHLNLLLLEHIRATTYFSIANMFAVNEFLFTYIFEKNISKEQLSELSVKIDEALSNRLFAGDDRYNSKEAIAELFLKIRNKIVPAFLLDCLQYVEEYKPTMVGFTCMFDQTIPSLALAKLIKEQYPDIFISFGGYALEGKPGYQIFKSFNFVDCISFGEGEKVIEQLSLASINKYKLSNIPNILYRVNDKILKTQLDTKPYNLNNSPYPNYDDFFYDLKELKQKYNITIKWNTIPIETSRGCWWGQKNHCVFCGIDDETIKYHQRSVDNTIEMITKLRTKYNSRYFRISDYILPYNYYNSLLPILSNLDEDNRNVFTCEIKANINSTQFKSLKDAGFVDIQPGIETFSTNILKKINKGVSAIQNIYCLILGHLNTIQVNYNILYCFPDDEPNDYSELLKTIPFLYHLNPPSSRLKVVITRFSPLQIDPKRFGFDGKYKHHPGYNVLFSQEFLKNNGFSLSNYCYYFETPYTNSYELETLYGLLTYQIDYWRSIHQERDVYLSYRVSENGIVFSDTRYNDIPKIKTYGKDVSDLYTECVGSLTNIEFLYKKFNNYSTDKIGSILNQLKEDRFIYVEGNKVIGLALKDEVYKRMKDETNKWASLNK